ncbi:hypothetical protein C7M84_016031 [Penaeus vannamei]|uniref:Uncharacterized protein n=1 Tax=Penaeus vannamei TaxID=6689 RepID=A0A423SPB0_PENVA|nr:hypothetical protein C7M84_016031 [Penaeus vannamei]
MKLLLLACIAVAHGSPLRARSNSASVYDYYDFVEIPRTQPVALSRADGPPPRRPRPSATRPPGGLHLRRPEPVYTARPHFEEDLVSYKDDPIVYHEEPVAYVEQPQFHDDLPEYHEKRPSFQNERPLYQSERPQYHEERPQYQEERPQYHEERPQYQEERPQYQEERPQYHEELEQYHDEPPHYQEERPSSRPERPAYEQTSEKEFRRPPANDFAPVLKEEESVKEKRQVAHGGGHFDEAGEKFAADAAAVENAKGAGRLAFQIHGQQGPHSYRFGYDTGKGKNRQFRYEERDGYGQVHGRYGFYDKDGKLQVVNYSAHPEHGFSADVPHP